MERASENLRSQIAQQSKVIREKDSELKDLKATLHESEETREELEVKLSHRESTILDMECHSSSLSKTIEQKEHDLATLKRNLADTENRLQVTIDLNDSPTPSSNPMLNKIHFYSFDPVLMELCFLDDREPKI